MAQRVESDLDLGGASRITNLPAPAADNDAARRVDLVFGQAAIIADVKAYNVGGGTFTSGAWRTRDLNTVQSGGAYVSLSSNQFTPEAGTWEIRASAPAFFVDRHFLRLYNITDSVEIALGQASYSRAADAQQDHALLVTHWTTDGSKVVELQHRCESTKINNGFGVETNTSGVSSIYAVVEICRLA